MHVVAVMCPRSAAGGLSFDGEILDGDLTITSRYHFNPKPVEIVFTLNQ